MDADMTNEVIAEATRADFYEFVAQKDWTNASAALDTLEEMKVSTYELRRVMNTEMDSPEEGDDYSNSREEDYGL